MSVSTPGGQSFDPDLLAPPPLSTAPPLETEWRTADLLYDGALDPPEGTDPADEWIETVPIFVGGARTLDLFFELRVPTFVTPRWFHWFPEVSPSGKREDCWYRPVVATADPDGALVQRAVLYKVAELEAGDVGAAGVVDRGLDPLEVRRQVRLEATGRFARLCVRGRGGRLRLYAIAGR